jgi:hypothetical protein
MIISHMKLNSGAWMILVCICITRSLNAQTDTSIHALQWSGYAELFYAFDFNQPEDHQRPSFLYSHNRHNEVNLNLGFVKAAYTQDNVRANLALGTGTYIHANYAQEPDFLQVVYEANAGIKLSRNRNLWLDAGIFSSHIGLESAISLDCPTLTRSMAAENSPYYESGIKVSYTTPDEKWFFSGLLLNGWQRIQRPDGNNTLALGSQITYTPTSAFKLNYSTFLGNDKPDDQKLLRHFHNLYGVADISSQLKVFAGVDIGFEQKSTSDDGWNTWITPAAILQYSPSAKWSVAGRWEYYRDAEGVIIYSGTPNGFQTHGYSLNIDYKISENAAWRIDGRMLRSKDRIFVRAQQSVNNNFCITTSIAVRL